MERLIYRLVLTVSKIFMLILFLYSSAFSTTETYNPFYIKEMGHTYAPMCHALWAGNQGDNTTFWIEKVIGEWHESNTAKLEWQAICLCDPSFKEYRNSSCNAYDFKTGKIFKGCQCVRVNKEKEEYTTPTIPDIFMTNKKYYKDGICYEPEKFDMTLVVIYLYSVFPEPSLKNAQKNSNVTVETTWNYSQERGHFSVKSKSTKSFEFCGDGKIQSDEGEKCDDGINNGKSGYCNCLCNDYLSTDKIELLSGDNIQGRIESQSKKLTVTTSYGEVSVSVPDIKKVEKNDTKNFSIELRNGDKLSGIIQEKSLDINDVRRGKSSVKFNSIKAITFASGISEQDCNK